LSQSLACVRLVLWDETAHRLITFRELRAQLGAVDQTECLAFPVSDEMARS
jgi:hypothetical protein